MLNHTNKRTCRDGVEGPGETVRVCAVQLGQVESYVTESTLSLMVALYDDFQWSALPADVDLWPSLTPPVGPWPEHPRIAAARAEIAAWLASEVSL
jgi:hypothetical protein